MKILTKKNSVKDKISILDIGNLFEIIREESSSRSLSVLVYLMLIYFGISWREVDSFLKDIGGLTAETCNRWSTVLLEQGLEEFLEDNRGGKHSERFYDIYPELEYKGKLYALEGCKRKSACFTCLELAQYLNDEYYNFTGQVRIMLSDFFSILVSEISF